MDILKKCQDYMEELKTINDAIDFLEKKQKDPNSTSEETKRYSMEEFRLCMDMVSVYEDLIESLNILEQKEDMGFLANRMRKNAKELLKVEIIDVTERI